MPVQIPLALKLPDHATFDNYFAGPNQVVIVNLRACADLEGEVCLYLWGRKGVGKTHLLQAVCRRTTEHGHRAVYIPLAQHEILSPMVLQELEMLDVVCLDDIDAVAGRSEWERALFDFYNKARDRGSRLVVAATGSPTAIPFQLADLASRLAWCPVFQFQGLSDADKLSALQLRARSRGMDLPSEVGSYLLRRCPRDTVRLFRLLDRLDCATLSAQRRLTIPFVKQLVD